MEIRNQTPFVAGWTVELDGQAAEHMVLVLKGSWAIGEDGSLALLEKQPPLRPADEFHGEPGKSSIRYAAELGPAKPATDVALVGHAVAPNGRASRVEVSLRVGPVSKRVVVHGDRRWTSFLGMRFRSGARPFERLALTFENASGGKDESPRSARRKGQDARNPVGRGYRARGSRLAWSKLLAPNLEVPGKPVGKPGRKLPPPAGFGFIGRDWEPRRAFAGTYDQPWLDERMPLLPLDFDPRFHNAAHPDLVARGHLAGDEPVEVVGCTRSGRLRFALPGVKPSAAVRFAGGVEAPDMKLETVLLDLDLMQLSMIWKADLPAHGRIPSVRRVEFGAQEGGA